MSRFLWVFFGLSLVGFSVLSMDFVQPAIGAFCLKLAQICYFFIHGFDAQVTLNAAILRHGTSGFALEVTEACSALSITALLMAAILAYPATWRAKALGLIAGVFLIQSFNVLRIMSLLYLGTWVERDTFDVVHEQVWPLFLHFGVIVFFVFWLWHNMTPATPPSEEEIAHAA